MECRIIESIYKDRFGEDKRKYYYVEVKKKFLWMRYWSPIKHIECGGLDCYDTTTMFNTHEEAQNFIYNVLCKKEKKDGWVDRVVNYINC